MTTPSSSEYRTIPLGNGVVASVDEEDYSQLSPFVWYAHKGGKNGSHIYAGRSVVVGGRRKILLMHRQILGLDFGDKRYGDHAQHNTLDNRRYVNGKPNLRIATSSENGCNRKRTGKTSSSGRRNIQLIAKSGMYRVRIAVGGKLMHIACRPTLQEAEAVYEEVKLKYHGDFAYSPEGFIVDIKSEVA